MTADGLIEKFGFRTAGGTLQCIRLGPTSLEENSDEPAPVLESEEEDAAANVPRLRITASVQRQINEVIWRAGEEGGAQESHPAAARPARDAEQAGEAPAKPDGRAR